jgi:hypothetical protein
MKSKKTTEKDLFGKPIRERKCRQQTALEKHDRESLEERIVRLKWVEKIFPKGYGFLMPPETVYVFNEAKMAFINGEFIATLLLVSAFVEHWLGIYIESKGFHKEAQKGLAVIIACARTNKLVHSALLDKADHLREIRNPFVHLKPFSHKDRVMHRALEMRDDPFSIMERDAKESLSIMYTIATTPLH